MKILLLADAGSEHTEKWAIGLAELGFEIGLFSLHPASYPWYDKHENILYLNSDFIDNQRQTAFPKLAYLKLIPLLKQTIKNFKPDLIHAHYASSYGLLARLSQFRPYYISAWGTDVMKFPDKNFIYCAILKKNLKNASKVFATSQTIKDYILRVVEIDIEIIPFGVDLNQFKPAKGLPLFEKDTLVIGAIKVLTSIYCIDVLISAFAEVAKRNPEIKIGLLIVGEGALRNKLEKQCENLGIQNQVIFTGRIDFSDVSNYFNSCDIFVNISEYESFGVSVIEASACEKPVIVSDVGGLREIVDEGINGLKVPPRNIQETVIAIEKLLNNKALRIEMGKNGRKKVEEKYDWKNNLQQMSKWYLNENKS